MVEAGWPLHHVQEMLGHADLKQTSTYPERHPDGPAGVHDALWHDAVCKSTRRGGIASWQRRNGERASKSLVN